MQLKPIPALLLGLAISGVAEAASPISGFLLEWTTIHGTAGLNTSVTSEILAFDSLTNTIWVAGVVGIDVLSASTGSLVQHIDTTGYGFVNSVAINNGIAAMAFENGADSA